MFLFLLFRYPLEKICGTVEEEDDVDELLSNIQWDWEPMKNSGQ